MDTRHPADRLASIPSSLDPRMSRRGLLRRLAATALAVPAVGALLTACSPSAPPPAAKPAESKPAEAAKPAAPAAPAATTAPAAPVAAPATPAEAAKPAAPAAAAPAAKAGGTAVIAVSASPVSWDITKSTWPTWHVLHNLYDRLLVTDEKEQLQPWLATSWEVSPDKLTYTLKLRQGVKFHDGSDFTSDSVKYMVERFQAKEDSAFNVTFKPVDRVETPDPGTAKIVLKEPRADFLYDLAQWGSIQISPTKAKELGDKFASQPSGTGPFKFKAYEPDSHVDLVRNEAYWGGAPILDGIRIRIIPEPTVKVTELQAKTADAAYDILPKDVEALKGKGVNVEPRVTPSVSFVSLNVSQGPTAELAVRKAIARAIDRDTMIKKVLLGYAEKARAGVPAGSPYYTEDVKPVELDPKESARILDEAGWKLGPNGIRQRDGKPLFVNILSSDFSGWGTYNQIIQEQLKAIGIDSAITSQEWGTYLDNWRENRGEWHVTYHSQGTQLAATTAILSSWAPEQFWSINQIRKSTDPETKKISDQLTAIYREFLGNGDLEKRKELSKQAQTIYQEQQLTVWLWHGQSLLGFQPKLKDYDLTFAGRVIGLAKARLDG